MKTSLYEKKEMSLKQYYTFGLTLLQLMSILGVIGLITTCVYDYFK